MATCSSCGYELAAGASFCEQCGQEIRGAESTGQAVKDPATGPLYEVHIRQYFRQGWKIFKLYPRGFLGFALIFLLVTAALGRLARGMPLLGFLLGAAIVPLNAGLYIVSAKLLQGQACQFEDFFAGFHYSQPLIIFGLIAGCVSKLGYLLPEDLLLRLLCHLAFLVFMVLFFFTPLLIVDRRLGWREAMDLSQRTVRRRWLAIVGFLLFGFLIAAGGFLALILGSLVTLPLFFAAVTAAYADIFGLQSIEY